MKSLVNDDGGGVINQASPLFEIFYPIICNPMKVFLSQVTIFVSNPCFDEFFVKNM